MLKQILTQHIADVQSHLYVTHSSFEFSRNTPSWQHRHFRRTSNGDKWEIVESWISFNANRHFTSCFEFILNWLISLSFLFLKFFGEHKSFLWGHWYPCFGLLMTFPLGFQPYSHLAEAYLLHISWDEIHLWCDTCWPLSSQHGSWDNLLHIPASRHCRGLNRRPIVPQANALPTELCQLGWFLYLTYFQK